jgi:hypothetical protein
MSAVTFALVLVFFLLISTSIMPSFWMYYAEQKIGWAGPPTSKRSCDWHLDREPVVAAGLPDPRRPRWASSRCVLVLVLSAALQNWRKSSAAASPAPAHRWTART